MKKMYPMNKQAYLAKIRAAALHFLCSVLIFLMALWWLLTWLYPNFHFGLNGGIYGLRLVASVDLVLGPLLTLLVYHHLKPLREKILDFAVVGAVQVAALVYGLHTMYEEHPKFLTYYQYGSAITVTQREWENITEPETLPNLTDLGTLAGVPIAFYDPSKQPSPFVKLTVTMLEQGDKVTRMEMSYQEDKDKLAALEQEHGKLYVFAILGKYQGAYVALDAQLNLIAVFGQRDLV